MGEKKVTKNQIINERRMTKEDIAGKKSIVNPKS